MVGYILIYKDIKKSDLVGIDRLKMEEAIAEMSKKAEEKMIRNISWQDACLKVAELGLVDYAICGIMKSVGSYNMLEGDDG